MVHVSTPPYGAAKIRYATPITYIVAVRCHVAPHRAVPYVTSSRYQPLVLGIHIKKSTYFLSIEKNSYSLVWIPRTMGWYLEVVTYGTARYGATWYGTERYCTVSSYIVKVRYGTVQKL